jgi:UDP-2,3-diacylglucosamine pyrophosphatase LpxH
MRIGLTGDLHWGISARHDKGVAAFIDSELSAASLSLLIVAGDLAEMAGLSGEEAGKNHASLFARLRSACDCPIAVCAGNHDIWAAKTKFDSMAIYRELLPRFAEAGGVTYLDKVNLRLPELTVVGCYGHFDYSLRTKGLEMNGTEVTFEHYATEIPPGYTHPLWMDSTMISWEHDDRDACRRICELGLQRMLAAGIRGKPILFVTHSVPRSELNGHHESDNKESQFRNAFCGTDLLESMIRAVAGKGVPITTVSGHTHRQVGPTEIDGVIYLNTGSEYGAPKLTVIDFPPAGEEHGA